MGMKSRPTHEGVGGREPLLWSAVLIHISLIHGGGAFTLQVGGPMEVSIGQLHEHTGGAVVEGVLHGPPTWVVGTPLRAGQAAAIRVNADGPLVHGKACGERGEVIVRHAKIGWYDNCQLDMV